MNRSLILGILFSISLLFLCACSTKNEKTSEDDEANGSTVTEVADDAPVEVSAMRLELTDFNYELISNGVIAAMNKAELRFQSQEVIRKIYVKNGDRVARGQTLAELDKFRLETSLAQAQEAFDRARLDLQDLLIGQGYSLKDSANIPAEVLRIARIRSNYDQSANSLSLAKYSLHEATLRAPFAGVVANLTVKEHNLSSSDAFCTVVDNSHPEVVFNILESELPFVSAGARVVVSPFSQPDNSAEGYITEINPLIDKNGMVRLKARIANSRNNLFYEGMNVKVRIQRLLGKQLVIPKSALTLRTNRKVVFTALNGLAQWNYVETAQENSDSYVIVSGLSQGDSVIYEGNENLAHESRVEVN